MGGEQAAQTMVNVTEAAMRRKGGEVDRARLAEMERRIVERFDSQMSVFTTSARLLDDAVIDPRDTRELLAQVLAICREAELRRPQPMQFSVARP
jgi:geranyl-CoA carboxylase beta subunit